MSLRHNKKRNVGLLNEFFSRYIAKAIIDNRDKKEIEVARDIYKKYFNKSTDLSKELKLFQTLFETKVSQRDVACSLISKVQEYCKIQSQERLELEKTALLHEINSRLGDTAFFDHPIKDYQSYATIQLLMNHWRGKFLTEDIKEVTMLEEKLIQHLISKQESINSNVLDMTNTEVDKLVLNIMSQKINSKFQKNLSENQKKVLKLYVFSSKNEDTKAELINLLENTRTKTLQLIQTKNSLNESKKEDSLVIGKLNQIKVLLEGEYKNTNALSDNLITFYMSVMKLEKELSDNE